jgi:hypothetical protein
LIGLSSKETEIKLKWFLVFKIGSENIYVYE